MRAMHSFTWHCVKKITQKQCKISIFLRTKNFCKYLPTRFCFSKLFKTEYSEEVHGSLLK